jgi:hypothetical protein
MMSEASSSTDTSSANTNSPETTNSALRVVQVLERVEFLNSQDAEVIPLLVWADALQVHDYQRGLPDEIANSLVRKIRWQVQMAFADFVGEIEALRLDIAKCLSTPHALFLQGEIASLQQYVADVDLSSFRPQSITRRLDQSVWFALRNLSYTLPSEQAVPQAELDQLEAEVLGLLELCKNPALDPDFRKWITELLEDVLRKLRQYGLHGAKIFRSAYVAMIGECLASHEAIQAKATTPEAKSLFSSLLSLCESVGTYMRRTANIAGGVLLTAKVAKLTYLAFSSGADPMDGLTSDVLEEIQDMPPTA